MLALPTAAVPCVDRLRQPSQKGEVALFRALVGLSANIAAWNLASLTLVLFGFVSSCWTHLFQIWKRLRPVIVFPAVVLRISGVLWTPPLALLFRVTWVAVILLGLRNNAEESTGGWGQARPATPQRFWSREQRKEALSLWVHYQVAGLSGSTHSGLGGSRSGLSRSVTAVLLGTSSCGCSLGSRVHLC